jgi:hypothetical protein
VKLAVVTFDNPFLDRLEVLDYEAELVCNNASFDYNGASIDNIIGFASEGTQIALEILDDARTKRKIWKNDKEIATEINQLVNNRRRTSDIEKYYGFHFVCNSVFLDLNIEAYLRGILSQTADNESRIALVFLYEIEQSGDIGEALKQLARPR